jgi:drug/metabolite transporter (DMT)-like permease
MQVHDPQVRRGILLALLAALISGVSVYVAKFGVQAVTDPFLYTAARNLNVGLLLLAMLLAAGRAGEVHSLSRATWGRLTVLAVVGGSVPFLLFFWGLSQTSATLAGTIQKTQFLWVAVLAAPVLGEKSSRIQWLALAALFVGVVLGGPFVSTAGGIGAFLVLGATLLWTAETLLVRRILRDVSPSLAATARMAGGAALLVAFLAASGRLPLLLGLRFDQLIWVVGPSILLLAYVLTWYAALQRAPATVVTSLLALGAPVTALLGLLGTDQLTSGGSALTALGFALVLGSIALLVASVRSAPPRGSLAEVRR